MLQGREDQVRAAEAQLREQEAVANQRAQDFVVAFARLDEQKRGLSSLDEKTAEHLARLHSREEEVRRTEARLREREAETRRCAEQLRTATVRLEEKERALAAREAVVCAGVGPARAEPHERGETDPTPDDDASGVEKKRRWF